MHGQGLHSIMSLLQGQEGPMRAEQRPPIWAPQAQPTQQYAQLQLQPPAQQPQVAQPAAAGAAASPGVWDRLSSLLGDTSEERQSKVNQFTTGLDQFANSFGDPMSVQTLPSPYSGGPISAQSDPGQVGLMELMHYIASGGGRGR